MAAPPPSINSGCFCMPLQNGVMLMGLIDVVIGVCFAVFDGWDAPLAFRYHTVYTQKINHLSSNNWYYNSDPYINSRTANSGFLRGPDFSRYQTRSSLEAIRHILSTAIAGIVFAVLFWAIEIIFGLFLFIGAMMKSHQQCMVWICLTILLRIATVFLNIGYHFALMHAVEESQSYGSDSGFEDYFKPGFTTAFVTLLIVLRCVAFIYKICEVVFVFMYSKEIKSSLELPAPTQTTTATLPQNQRSATGFQNKTIGLAQPSPSNYASVTVVGPTQPMPSYGGAGAVNNAQIKQV